MEQSTDSLKKRYQIALNRWIMGDSPGLNSIAPFIGADREFVREWISDRFLSGMDWDNYGKVWMAAHIVPLRFFDLSKEDDLRVVLNYKNLTPIFKEDISFKDNMFDLSLKMLESLHTCEITKELKATLLIENKKLNKYILNTRPPDVIFLNAIGFEMIKEQKFRRCNKYEILYGNIKCLTVINDHLSKKSVKDVSLSHLNMPMIRIDKNFLYVEMWDFTNDANSNNQKRLNIAFNNEIKKRGFNIPT